MVIFNSYVSLPEGISWNLWHLSDCLGEETEFSPGANRWESGREHESQTRHLKLGDGVAIPPIQDDCNWLAVAYPIHKWLVTCYKF